METRQAPAQHSWSNGQVNLLELTTPVRPSPPSFLDAARLAALHTHVFPVLAAEGATNVPLRVWVPGCSTGALVYELAFELLAFFGDARPIKVFGTDASQLAIDCAREGLYDEASLADLSPQLRASHLERVEQGSQLPEHLRCRCVFARHDFTRDPPFSKLDLICVPRELNAGLDPERAAATLHYALAPRGFLWLGAAARWAGIERRFQAVAGQPGLYVRIDDFSHTLDELLQRSTVDDDFTASREELVSSNEDLQSLNEELTTTQDQLQAVNEELRALNQQLERRNQEAARINSDLINVLATVDIPILIVDSERRIRRFTPNARCILNIIESDLGRPFTDLRCNIDAPRLDQQVGEVIESGIGTEWEVRALNGRWHRLQIHPYKNLDLDEGNEGAIISLIDIDNLKDLVQRAELANQQAEQANRIKDEFLATLSHELRSPLHGMLAHAQLMRRGPLDEARMLKASETIETGVLMLSRLIDDLLDVSRILNGKMRLDMRSVDLASVVSRALESVADKCARCALNVSLQVPPVSDAAMVLGDAMRLEQVVANLISNAIKFTPAGGTIAVSLRREAGFVVLTVRDSGMGIDSSFLPHVFNRFSQANTSLNREFGGLGLGLAIVRYFVEVHHGEASAESDGLGMGSTFRVSLPLLDVAADRPRVETPKAAIQSAPDLLLDGVRVLLVDDDRAARQAVDQLLQQAGAEVWSVPSASDAIEAVSQFSPHVMLCDIAMPGEDGLSLIRRVRALDDAKYAGIPALALTAHARAEDRERILGAGYQRHLPKPIDIDVLTRALADLHAQ